MLHFTSSAAFVFFPPGGRVTWQSPDTPECQSPSDPSATTYLNPGSCSDSCLFDRPFVPSCSAEPTFTVFTWNNEWIPLFFGPRHDSSWFHMEPRKLWQPLIKLSIYQPSGCESPRINQLETLEGGRRLRLCFCSFWWETAGTWRGRWRLWFICDVTR